MSGFLNFSYEVMAPNLDGLLVEAFRHGQALFGERYTITATDFATFDVRAEKVGRETTYTAYCAVRVPFQAPEPALWFGKL